MIYPTGSKPDMSSFWNISGLPAPTVITAEAVGQSGKVTSWQTSVRYQGQRYAFRSVVKNVGAFYVNQLSHFILVVA